jgi:hypothetical protein
MISDRDRDIELTKARMLEIQAAYLRIMIDHRDTPRDFDGVRRLILRTAAEWEEQCQNIRYNIAEGINPREENNGESPP